MASETQQPSSVRLSRDPLGAVSPPPSSSHREEEEEAAKDDDELQTNSNHSVDAAAALLFPSSSKGHNNSAEASPPSRSSSSSSSSSSPSPSSSSPSLPSAGGGGDQQQQPEQVLQGKDPSSDSIEDEEEGNGVVTTSKKQDEFLLLFDVPATESLLNDYSCAYNKEGMLYHGRMYVSKNFACFHSQIFKKTRIILPFDQVLKISKRNTALVFPNAIEFVTKSQKALFASFLHRDQAYNLITALWEGAKRQPLTTFSKEQTEQEHLPGSDEDQSYKDGSETTDNTDDEDASSFSSSATDEEEEEEGENDDKEDEKEDGNEKGVQREQGGQGEEEEESRTDRKSKLSALKQTLTRQRSGSVEKSPSPPSSSRLTRSSTDHKDAYEKKVMFAVPQEAQQQTTTPTKSPALNKVKSESYLSRASFRQSAPWPLNKVMETIGEYVGEDWTSAAAPSSSSSSAVPTTAASKKERELHRPTSSPIAVQAASSTLEQQQQRGSPPSAAKSLSPTRNWKSEDLVDHPLSPSPSDYEEAASNVPSETSISPPDERRMSPTRREMVESSANDVLTVQASSVASPNVGARSDQLPMKRVKPYPRRKSKKSRSKRATKVPKRKISAEGQFAMEDDIVGGSGEEDEEDEVDSEDEEDEEEAEVEPGEQPQEAKPIDVPLGPECTHFTGGTNGQEIVNQVLPIPVSKFYEYFLSDEGTSFWEDHYSSLQYTEFTTTPWAKDSASCCASRLMTFRVPMNFPVGPKSTRVEQTQRIRFENKRNLHVETLNVSKDAPYGDSFHLEAVWHLTPTGENDASTHVNIRIRVVFTKSFWMKSMIEKFSLEGMRTFFPEWMERARKLAAARQQQEAAERQSRPANTSKASSSSKLKTASRKKSTKKGKGTVRKSADRKTTATKAKEKEKDTTASSLASATAPAAAAPNSMALPPSSSLLPSIPSSTTASTPLPLASSALLDKRLSILNGVTISHVLLLVLWGSVLCLLLPMFFSQSSRLATLESALSESHRLNGQLQERVAFTHSLLSLVAGEEKGGKENEGRSWSEFVELQWQYWQRNREMDASEVVRREQLANVQKQLKQTMQLIDQLQGIQQQSPPQKENGLLQEKSY